ncbi:MAG TPA: bifunctional 4-hydroxy-2-oxoglutarate aldolase/2-dehydro-3-deoxy-phosphogluconate aldolase [Solirubrobacteraceae bacterium]|nr:bifunctional 4-hydroxy-2-oxoglutarate aldolase/2-dehydro-3-deoxy-phosphogluconate aldolase [Solirubrobacteraceae bacterium]
MTSTLDRLRATRVVAVIRAPDAAGAVRAVDALVRGGVTGIEITYSTPDVPGVLAAVAERHGDAVLLGAGTLRAPAQAIEAVAAGARFLVAPGLDDELVAAMRATGALTMAGALTPTEVMRAQALAVDVVKVFPASLGGPAYVRALRGPFPDVPFMPTGGVSAANLREWLDAGVVAVGAGGELCSATDIADGRFEAIEASARAFAGVPA